VLEACEGGIEVEGQRLQLNACRNRTRKDNEKDRLIEALRLEILICWWKLKLRKSSFPIIFSLSYLESGFNSSSTTTSSEAHTTRDPTAATTGPPPLAYKHRTAEEVISPTPSPASSPPPSPVPVAASTFATAFQPSVASLTGA
jgi:hypothetical protein